MSRGEAPPALIREATLADASVLAALVTLWGYPADQPTVARRLSRVTGDAEAVLVAVVQSEVIGWVHVGLYPSLAADDAAELRGLVVSAQWQRQGIGRQLMSAAEAWARQRGCRTMYVRSRTSRHEAHEFYRRLGYRQLKTSFAFERALRSAQDGSEPWRP